MTKKEKKQNKREEKVEAKKVEEKKEFLPPLDFVSIVLPFYTQALVKLGQTENPMTQKKEENLDLAKRLIDILDLLKEKTKGNLDPEEEKFLLASIDQLKMIYLEKTKIITT
jgi:hypothetical protein